MKEKNKFWGLLLGVVAAFMFSIGFASMGMAESASQKIGFVDMGKVMKESKVAKSSISVLQKEIESKNAIIKERTDKIAGMDKELANLKKDSSAWKEKREKMTKEIEEVNRLRGEYQRELQKKDAELVRKLYADVQQVIKKIAGSEKCTIVLEKRSVLFAEDGVDLTDKVLKMYDSQKK